MNAEPETPPTTLPAAFSAAVAAHPDRPAIVAADRIVSYRELDDLAAGVARVLAGRGIGPGQRVGLVTRRVTGFFPLLLGVLRSGACVVPVNADYPDAMKGAMAEQAELDLILGWEPSAWAPVPDRAVLAAELLAAASASSSAATEPAAAAIDPDSPAYLLFTSGSTARPKAVVVPHRGIARLAGASPVALTADDRILQSSPLSFASSMSEVWLGLLHGAAVVLAPPGKPSLPEYAALVAEHGISFLNLPCGLFRLLVDHELDALRGLRAILVSGDFVSLPHVRKLVRETGVRLFHGYGCTETSAIASMQLITASLVPDGFAGPLPIGGLLPGVRMTVRDESLAEVGPGEPGELCLGGVGLALGYLDQPELTAAKFVADPRTGERLLRTGDRARTDTAGLITLAGREDDMVKVRGHRVETRGVERAIITLAPTVEPVVKAFPDGHGDSRLAVFYTTADGAPADERALRGRLGEVVPDYMVPTQWCHLDAMPLNVNGKTNRLALDEGVLRGRNRARATAPEIDLPRLVVSVFTAVMAQPIDVDESFWAAGGTSLDFIDMAARLQADLGITVRAEHVMENDTANLLGRVLAEELANRGSSPRPDGG
jgi:amino acid adenylation domain-containing protein